MKRKKNRVHTNEKCTFLARKNIENIMKNEKETKKKKNIQNIFIKY